MMSKELHDRFSNAEMELEEKNAYVCETCGERHRESELHDRFSEAISELAEKNAFICTSCGGRMVRSGHGGRPLKVGKGGELSVPAH